MYGQIDFDTLIAMLDDRLKESKSADDTVNIKGVTNVHSYPMKDYEVTSCYTDIFIIINMLYDYAEMVPENTPLNTYYKKRFKEIADSLAKQIDYDYESTVNKCNRRSKDVSSVGEGAFEQLLVPKKAN